MAEGFRTFDHTGDLGLEVWADTPERLYALAAEALLAQVAEVGPAEVEARPAERGVRPAEAEAGARPAERGVRPAAAGARPAEVEARATLELEGDDARDLLVHWLNTALLESGLRQAVWTRAEVRSLSERSLSGTLAGPRLDPRRQVFLREVKAVSHHYLDLDLTPGRCRCRVILDI